jgi:hypothetical protein
MSTQDARLGMTRTATATRHSVRRFACKGGLMSPQDPQTTPTTPDTPPAAADAPATPAGAPPAAATTPTAPAAASTGVQSALTLVMPIKSPEAYQQLYQTLTHFQSLPPDQNPLTVALNATHLVHFARFIFLENNTKLAVITSFDGSMEAYINAFIDHVGGVFDVLLAAMADAPPLPVEKFRAEFLQYVNAHDLPIVQPFYSAYPSLSVLQILDNAANGAS